MPQIAATNEFVLRFANVNGTGSASANAMVAKSLFRMGIPVGPKNMFPSNIQGLPTWYEVRVSAKGFTGRRGGVDFVVAMNGQTLAEDVASVSPGGYLLYDSSRDLPPKLRREDLTYIGIPLTEICRTEFANPRQRALLQNIVYVGALSSLLSIEKSVLEALIGEQFAKNQKLVDLNLRALKMGADYATKHFQCPLPLRVARLDRVGDQILFEGNAAAGLGCVFAGATVAGWYPITPSTSLVDSFAKYCAKFRTDANTGHKKYAIVQAEDELSAIGMVLGASWNGARSFTATSGPGVSLMSEFLGFAYYAEVPVVLFNVQRCGPSTGMPTRTQQSDLISTAYASHGDTRHVLLFPAHPGECFDDAVRAFDLAELLQTPVIVMMDIDLGMNEWMIPPLKWDEGFKPNRGKVLDQAGLDRAEKFFRYLDMDGDGIPYRTLPGTHPAKGSYFTRGSGHDKFGRYTEDGAAYKENMDRLLEKFQKSVTLLPRPIIRRRGGDRPGAKNGGAPKLGLIAIGTSDEAVREGLDLLAQRGVYVDDLRIRAFPFAEEVAQFIAEHDTVFVLDQNRDGQLAGMLAMELGISRAQMISLLHYDGMPMTATWVEARIPERLNSVASREARP